MAETESPPGWRAFDYAELMKRDKVNLDIFWLRNKSLEDSDDLPEPDVLAREIADATKQSGYAESSWSLVPEDIERQLRSHHSVIDQDVRWLQSMREGNDVYCSKKPPETPLADFLREQLISPRARNFKEIHPHILSCCRIHCVGADAVDELVTLLREDISTRGCRPDGDSGHYTRRRSLEFCVIKSNTAESEIGWGLYAITERVSSLYLGINTYAAVPLATSSKR